MNENEDRKKIINNVIIINIFLCFDKRLLKTLNKQANKKIVYKLW